MSSVHGTHTPAAYPTVLCSRDGCGRPMVCTRTGLWECDHNGGPQAHDGLPGVGQTPIPRPKPRQVIELPPINGHIGRGQPPSTKQRRRDRWTG